MVRALQDYVTQQAERRPQAVALVSGNQRVAYEELESRSNQLARLLREGRCRPGDRIALLLPKSPAAVVGMLGVLKAEAIYVPVDPESPAARIEKILRAADCRYWLASAASLSLLDDLMLRFDLQNRPGVVWMEDERPVASAFEPVFTAADAATFSAEPLPRAGGDDAIAHILFTSGSTGAPKGVMVAHANVIAFVTWANAYFGYEPGDRVSCHSPLHFDLSTFDLYGAFAAGAEVHLVPSEFNLFPRRLVDFIRSHRLTQWFSVPSILTYLARFDAVEPGAFPDLKRVLWCGEVFPTPPLRYWMERLPHVSFTNLYGPTEATIASSYYTVPAPPADPHASVPIGTPCGGEELLILDEAMTPLPPGEVGEIYIGGAGVTAGYWRDEEKTRRAFVLAKDAGGSSRRLYRTGDLGYLGTDGLVYFLGRADSQIKSRGHRIELGEIEAALHTIPEVGQGAIVAIEDHAFGGHAICCAYASRAGCETEPAAVRERLATLIPKYMLPAHWRRMTELPANANGKVDRVALTDMFRRESARNDASPAGD